MAIATRAGSCTCGKVRYAVEGEPARVGVCHCTLCRQETGSVMMVFAVWPRAVFSFSGETRTWEGRSFCPNCGSRLFSIGDDEVEIKLGTLQDAPTDLTPQYELWVWRREHWLSPLAGARQFQRDREP
jgi:hypothetical protein